MIPYPNCPWKLSPIPPAPQQHSILSTLDQSAPSDSSLKPRSQALPGGSVVKTSPSSAGGESLIPGPGAKIPYASQPKNQNIKQKQYCNKFDKCF